MKLSELVSYVNTINSLSTDEIGQKVDVELRKVLTDMKHNEMPTSFDNDFDSVHSSAQSVLDSLNELNDNLDNLKGKIKVHRREFEADALAESYNIYELAQRRVDKTSYLFDVHVPHLKQYFNDAKIDDYLNDRLKKYSSWHHPSAIIRPLNGEYNEPLIASDVLYVLDEEPGLLEPTRKQFTPEYQARLRYKVIDETLDEYIVNLLPKGQLGFIFLNEFINFRPMEVIKQYLKEIQVLLKPGGVAMFTYNNCDLPGSVRNFEHKMYCYTPSTLLIPMIESLGFEIINKFDDSSFNRSWVEIKKDGTLETIKGGQTLAEIVKEVDQST